MAKKTYSQHEVDEIIDLDGDHEKLARSIRRGFWRVRRDRPRRWCGGS